MVGVVVKLCLYVTAIPVIVSKESLQVVGIPLAHKLSMQEVPLHYSDCPALVSSNVRI